MYYHCDDCEDNKDNELLSSIGQMRVAWGHIEQFLDSVRDPEDKFTWLGDPDQPVIWYLSRNQMLARKGISDLWKRFHTKRGKGHRNP